MSLRHRNVIRCRPCGRWVRRAHTVHGTTVVLDPVPDLRGTWLVERNTWRRLDEGEITDEPTFREHRDTCGARRPDGGPE